MSPHWILALALAALAVAPSPQESSPAGDDPTATSWPSFRGPRAHGVAEGYPTAVHWDVESGGNIRWKTEIPGLAHSSPVVWGDRVFVTTAIADSEQVLRVGLYGDPTSVPDEGLHSFEVYCLDKATGEVLWSEVAIEAEPLMKRHPKGSHAASSPATNGEVVLAFFASEGLYCYDVDGILLWSVDFGDLDSSWYEREGDQFGFASSPVIHEDVVVIQCDVLRDSFLTVLDLETGEEVWRIPRTDMPTWSSPTVDVREGRSQIIVNGYQHIGGYDLETGAELWKLVGGGDVPVPTPVVAHDLVFITNAHGRLAPIYAVRIDAEGLIAGFEDDPQMAWSYPRRGNYMQTPLVYGDHLYLCSDAGIVSCFEARTGKELSRARLGAGRSGFTASAVAADGKLYFTSEDGEIYVLKADPELAVLARNEMGETCMATPAISEGLLLWRTRSHLVAVEAGDEVATAEEAADPALQLRTFAEVELKRDQLEPLVGDYELGPDAFLEVRLEEEQLKAGVRGQPAYPIFPESETRFFFRITDAQITFEKDEQGEVTGLVLHQDGQDIRGARVK